MSDPTQTIPASELDRFADEAWEAFKHETTFGSVLREGYIAGAKSEYLRREREVRELKELLRECEQFAAAAPAYPGKYALQQKILSALQ